MKVLVNNGVKIRTILKPNKSRDSQGEDGISSHFGLSKMDIKFHVHVDVSCIALGIVLT